MNKIQNFNLQITEKNKEIKKLEKEVFKLEMGIIKIENEVIESLKKIDLPPQHIVQECRRVKCGTYTINKISLVIKYKKTKIIYLIDLLKNDIDAYIFEENKDGNYINGFDAIKKRIFKKIKKQTRRTND